MTHTHITCSSLHSPAVRFVLCPATSCPHLQPMRSCHHFKFCFFQWTFVQNTLPNFLLSSIKGHSYFVLKTCLWFTIVCLSWIVIPLLFPNKPDFAAWIIYLLLLKSWHNPIKKWTKGFSRYFKSDIKIAKKHMKIYSTSLANREIKTTIRYYFHTHLDSYFKKTQLTN